MSGNIRRVAIGASLLFILLVLFAPQTPITLGYATSDSMEPAIPRGALYVVYETTAVEAGDIIMFNSEYRKQFVTHRVVNEVPDGYITKGDANPSTDQRGGHPPVARDMVIGTVVGVGGYTIAVPGVGVWAEFVAENRTLAFAALWVLLLSGLLSPTEKHGRRVVRVKHLVRPLLIIAVVTTVTVMMLASASVSVNFYASNVEGVDSPLLISPDEPTTTTVPLEVQAFSEYTYTMVRTDTGVVEQVSTADPSGMIEVTLSLPAPERSGTIPAVIEVYHYPRVLPYQVVAFFHSIHPSVAGVGVTVASLFPGFILYFLLVDPEEPLYSGDDSNELPVREGDSL